MADAVAHGPRKPAAGASHAGLLPYVQALREPFGARRLVRGSDWPVVTLVCNYPTWFSLSVALLDSLDPRASAQDIVATFGGNAVTLYRLQHHADCPL